MPIQNSQVPFGSVNSVLTEAFDYDPTSKLAIYHGWAGPSAAKSAKAWAIVKFTYNVENQVTDIQWAGGQATFHVAWDDRAGLSYS